MTEGEKDIATSTEYYDAEKNGAMVLKLFTAYYQSNNHSGKLYDDSPNFFLVKPQALEGHDIATRSSDKLLLADCIQRAKARNGYIGVS